MHHIEITAGGNIQCDGPYGCGECVMSAHDDIRLFGFGSGHKAVITDTPIIYAHGYYAAAYSDIYGISEGKMLVQFHGHYSGYYANVWCASGSKCTVSCRGTGCLEVVVFNEHREDVVIDPLECGHIYHQGDVYEGVHCPKLMQYDESGETNQPTKDEVEERRLRMRQMSDKWETLDDVYDMQEEPGSPLDGPIMMANDENVHVITHQFDPSFSSFVLYFAFGSLFTCIGMHCYWNRKEKRIALEEPALMYM